MLHHVWPEGCLAATGDEVGAHVLEDGPNRAFGNAVELVYVRRAACLRDGGLVEQLAELLREELAGVVRVQGAEHLDRRGATPVEQSVEFGDEFSYARRCLALVPQEVDLFVPRVIVDEHEKVLVLPVD